MQALVRFSHIAAGGIFRTREIHADVAQALSLSTDQYKLGSLRYDLSKLRAKGLVEKLPTRALTDSPSPAIKSVWCF